MTVRLSLEKMMSAWAEAGSKENQATGTHKQHQVSPAGAQPSGDRATWSGRENSACCMQGRHVARRHGGGSGCCPPRRRQEAGRQRHSGRGVSAGSRRAPSLAEGCFELVRLQPASVAEVFMAGIRMSFALAAPRCLSFSIPLPPSSLSQLTSP